MSFDIDRATQFIRNYRLDIIKRHYPENHKRAYEEYNIPKEFEPKYWVYLNDTVVYDLARLVRFALSESDKGNIPIEAIDQIMPYFSDYCIIERGMLFQEMEKENDILSLLINAEYYYLDKPFCETTRLFLEIWLDMILDKKKAARRYEMENNSIWELIKSASFMNERPINDYLLRRLKAEVDTRSIDDLVEALGENRVREAIEIINDRIRGGVADHTRLVEAIIQYCRDVDTSESVELLSKVQHDFVKNMPGDVRFKSDFEVAFCKLEKGEKGLIELFNETNDHNIKIEIIRCYKYFRSQAFASMLVEALSDPFSLENGHFPVRACASTELYSESFIKLIEWFGYDVVDKVRACLTKCHG